jgi:hypothetical protein
MAYRNASHLTPELIKASNKLVLYQNQRVYKLRLKYPKELCPRLHSLSPLKLLLGNNKTSKKTKNKYKGIKKGTEDYLHITQQLARSAGVKVGEHGKVWSYVAKQAFIEDIDPNCKEYLQQAKQAYKLASKENIRIQLKAKTRLTVQNAVINTRVLIYLLVLRDNRLLISEPNHAFSLTMLAQIARKALKLPHFAHLDTTLELGLRLMGLSLSNGLYGRMVMGAKLIYKDEDL